ncbi:MAG TPA: thiamine phosphate synthase [Blastocatellia bacterium]|nr:thiamine phosphate synthase [Blastocatellia bacterium]
MRFQLPRFYPITDTRLGGLTHREQVEQLAAGGARLIQLRDKLATPRDFYRSSVEAIAAARKLGVRIIINDRLDIAVAAGADGVHLGQDDLPVEEARRIVGDRLIIGFSTHSVEQALAADSLAVDYVAVGPVFETSTKDRPDPVVGLDLIREVKSRLSRPLVAIGGITLSRAPQVIEAGADSLAVISDLYSTGSIPDRVRAFLEATGSNQLDNL